MFLLLQLTVNGLPDNMTTVTYKRKVLSVEGKVKVVERGGMKK
jgi:hypothetical protein